MIAPNFSSFFGSILTVLFVYFVLSVSIASGECREKVRISLLGDTAEEKSRNFHSLYKFETDTRKCAEAESLLLSSHTAYCDSQDIDVSFSSVAVLPNGTNMLPYVLLNVSVRVNAPTSSVFLRLECLEAPNLDDDYCHNHEEQHRRWGRMIWPCRSVTLFEPNLVSYPYFFQYHCFRLSAYSQYRFNVSVAPKSCRKSFIVTIPEEAQLHFAINQFYNADAKPEIHQWSPLVFVDLSLQDGVIIRYDKNPNSAVLRISVAVFETTASSLTHLFTETIIAPVVEYKWSNVPAGNYTAYLYVNRIGCDLMCDGDFATDSECIRCPSTRIHFTVHEDKFWLPVPIFGLPYLTVFIIGGAVALCFITVIASVVYFLIHRRRKVNLREISLSQRTTIFLAYTDDCEPHSNCVAALAEILQLNANADVFLDQFELKCSETIPARWFVSKLTTANHVLLIFSEAAYAVVRGEKLIQRQPFPEFFPTAVNFAISECNKDVQPVALPPKASSRFAFAYFTYSSPSVIPMELTAIPVNLFRLPEQIEKLILWLHGQPADIHADIHVDIGQLESAINEVLRYRHDNPKWLTEKLQTKGEDGAITFAPQNIPYQASRPMLTPEEQVVVAEALNLEPPDDVHMSMDEEYTKEDARFALIGSPDDSNSDSDDSTSDKILLQQLLTAKRNSVKCKFK